MNAFINHFSFEFRTGIRNRQLLLMNYLFPLGFYLMMGFVMPAINPPFLASLIPAMVVFAILAATFLGLPDPLVKAREDGIFRSYKINGIPAGSILTIPALTTLLHLVIVTVIITVTAPILFDAPLPVDYLKIDGSFVRDLTRNPVDQHLIKAIVEVARALGKKTVAEYVGDEETLCLLQQFGVDYGQGFYLGKPERLAVSLSHDWSSGPPGAVETRECAVSTLGD